MQRRYRRQRPQNDHEREQRDAGVEQLQADGQRQLDEISDIFCDALVGVVGGVAQKLHAIMIGALQPMIEIAVGQPTPPADLQPLIEIELIDIQSDEKAGQNAEIAKLVDEDIPVTVLQRIVEPAVPLVEQHRERDQGEFDADDRRQQNAAGPAIVRTEIRTGNSPDDGERRENTSHGWSPIAAVCGARRKMKLTMVDRMDGEARN